MFCGSMLLTLLRTLLATDAIVSPPSTDKGHVLQLRHLCSAPKTAVFVRDAVTVVLDKPLANASDNATLTEPDSCELTFDLLPQYGVYLLVVVRNYLPINRELCQVWDPMVRLRSFKQSWSLGCVRAGSHFFEPPVSLTVSWVVFRMLLVEHWRGSLAVTATAVGFQCGRHDGVHGSLGQPYSRRWRRCRLDEAFCIRRTLFCDKINNCGLWEDESECGPEFASANLTAERAEIDKAAPDSSASSVGDLFPATVGVVVFFAITTWVCCVYVCWSNHVQRRIPCRVRRWWGKDGRSSTWRRTRRSNVIEALDELDGADLEWLAEQRALFGIRR